MARLLRRTSYLKGEKGTRRKILGDIVTLERNPSISRLTDGSNGKSFTPEINEIHCKTVLQIHLSAFTDSDDAATVTVCLFTIQYKSAPAPRSPCFVALKCSLVIEFKVT